GFGAGDSNLYRYVGNKPAGATDPRGLLPSVLGIKSKGIYVGNCRAFAWPVSFQLDEKTEQGGYIVQEIRSKLKVYDCRGAIVTTGRDEEGNPSPVDFSHYLEAWPVSKNYDSPRGTSRLGADYNKVMDGIVAKIPKYPRGDNVFNDLYWYVGPFA